MHNYMRTIGGIMTTLIVCLSALTLPAIQPASALREASNSTSTQLEARTPSCAEYTCRYWRQGFYAHGWIPIPSWDRCIVWQYRAGLRYKLLENMWHTGDKVHWLNWGIQIRNSKLKFAVHRKCDDSTARRLGGLSVTPSLHMTGQYSGSCTLVPSVAVNFPWGVSVGASPSCKKAQIAKRDSAHTVGKNSSVYYFSEAQPNKTQ